FPIELAIQPIELGEQPVFTAYLRDISARKEAEKDLEDANARAMESAEAKERFLANMSHEMRTPLNAVIGMTHLLQDTTLDSTQYRYVSTIQFASDNLLALISDLLDYSKITAGKVVFEEVSFSLDELLEGLQNTFSFRAQEKGLQFAVLRDPDLPNRITGDPVRLSQILLNLISNAIKFTEKGGVTVRVRRDGGNDDAVEVAFDIIDTGVGIGADDIEHIFDSFTQATSETTRRFGGTGLGLAIVKELVDRQGGLIDVESDLGQGSRFSVCLPFAISDDDELNADHPARMPTAEGLRGKHILVAEDNEINQFVVCSMLQRWGAETAVAHNGAQAVEMARSGGHDLILMDIQMPEMDGHDACVAIRQELRLAAKDLPIIALTASTAPDERDRLLRAGMQDFVLKPFEPGALYERLLHHLNLNADATRAGDHDPDAQQAGELFNRSRFDTTTLGDPSLGIRLIDVYLNEADDHETTLRQLADREDWEAMGSFAHRLKSSAGSLGLVALQQRLLDLEGSVRVEHPVLDPESLSSTIDIMRQSRELLTRLKARLNNA
ncbi:MAG: response regulator, partial [Rhodothermales bacterium]|nr:response regulator [Rhodothermales bacterium]